MSVASACTLIRVSTAADWRSYHDIRRRELWDKRGLTGYDASHPDEMKPGHYPLLLVCDDLAIGTLRLDVAPGGMGILRLGAIAEDWQGKGFGRTLFRLAEQEARTLGLTHLVLNAYPENVGFYSHEGWQQQVWDNDGRYVADPSCVQMVKQL